MATDPELPVNLHKREVFVVDGVRASLDLNGLWQCTCADHTQASQCTHVGQAQAYRQMRGAKPEDDTIEMELTAEELQSLYIAAAVGQPDFVPPQAVAPSKRVMPRSRWAAVLVTAGIAGISCAATYLATVREEPVQVAQLTVPQALAVPAVNLASPPPVTVTNPFDATEVFEFPADMSETDARDAMAQILLSRARERLATSGDTPRWSAKPAHDLRSARATRL